MLALVSISGVGVCNTHLPQSCFTDFSRIPVVLHFVVPANVSMSHLNVRA